MTSSDDSRGTHDQHDTTPSPGGSDGADAHPAGHPAPGSTWAPPPAGSTPTTGAYYDRSGHGTGPGPGQPAPGGQQPGYGQPGYGSTPYPTTPYGGGYGSGSGGAYGSGSGGYGSGAYGSEAGGYGSGYGTTPYAGAGYGTGTETPGPDAPAAEGTPPAAARRGPGTGRVVAIAAVVALLVGGGVAAATAALVDHGTGTTSAGSAGLSTSTQSAPAAKVDGSVAGAAAAISPSVVTINVSAGQQGGTGSGIVIKDTGYILTNNHVVSLDSQTQASSNQISVTLRDGSTKDAKVVGTDPADDLAVVKIDGSGLAAATFASSSKLAVGQTVVAMGAPLGLSNTVTSGIVSALARPVATGDQNSASIFNAIQTDAAINPGNSGGPLVDLNGHVVGVNSAIAGTSQSSGGGAQSGNIGIGFAIPSDEASRIADQLISTGKATHAVLGISVSGTNQQSLGPTSATGATVSQVQSGSPAAKAGIKSGDVITKIGDQRIDDSVGAIAATRSFAPGTTVPVTVQTNGSSHTVQVTLGSSTNS